MNFSLDKRLFLVYIFLIFGLSFGAAQGQSKLSPRIQIGVNLFPAVIAANQALSSDDSAFTIEIFVTYLSNPSMAEIARNQLGKIKKIRGHNVSINSISVEELLTRTPPKFSAIIIVEEMSRRLNSLIRFSHQNQITLFSPFKGDVKKGVMSGFEVTDKVLPSINLDSMKKSNISLKTFFMRIAIKYD